MQLPSKYEPSQYESDIYSLWESAKAFSPSGDGEPYSIVMPPPNANGDLHVGHTLLLALEDVLVRYHRMIGRKVVWLPGEDHAGFETWVVFERELEKQGKSRFDFSRDELYDMTFQFVNQYRGQMEDQFKRLGASCDWEKLTFTLDPNVVGVTYGTFKKMWDDDLIYRGERIVNYCTKHQTSFSDIEVEYKDEKGHLWEIKYPLSDGSGEVVVATTRPETMLGDTAVAVHPKDERYTELIGKKVNLPLSGRQIKIVADEMVDRDFGTGAVKITPAHDPNDFEVGQRHKLEQISVIGLDGRTTSDVPEKYRDLTVAEARKAVVKDLKLGDYLVSEKSFVHSVGHCYKCGTVIEPMLRDQWFVRMTELAKRAIKAIRDGDIKFYPANKGRVLINYLKNLKDWNISRQIPWGIPIPAFQNENNADDWIFSDKVSQETIEHDGNIYRRDPDTFDTWFSSGQWPFITTLFNASSSLEEFYPTSVMETGHDIMFPWVSKMIMLGLYVTDQVPFKEVYLHGLVLDEHSHKMSKSKGNVVSPITILDKYGSDALRQGLIANRSAGVNQAFSDATVVAGRNFCNKLWNIARLVVDKLADDEITEVAAQPETIADHWITGVLSNATEQVARLIEQYRFAEGYELVYHTIWDEVADWYLEASKVDGSRKHLAWVIDTCLRLAHPFAPFVTETIWQNLSWTDDTSLLISASWPLVAEYSEVEADKFEEIKQIVSEVRNIATSIKSRDIALVFEDDEIIKENTEVIRHLSGIGYVAQSKAGHDLRLTSTLRPAWLDVDMTQLGTYRDSIVADLQKLNRENGILAGRLANEGYIESAPKDLIEQSRDRLAEVQEHIRRLDVELVNVHKALKSK